MSLLDLILTRRSIRKYEDKDIPEEVSKPEGKLPSESTYMYVAKMEVSDLDAIIRFL